MEAPDPSSRVGCRGESLGPGHTHVPPTDGEKLTGVTDGRGVRGALSTQRAEDSSESREEEQAVSMAVEEGPCVLLTGTLSLFVWAVSTEGPCSSGVAWHHARPRRRQTWAWGSGGPGL